MFAADTNLFISDSNIENLYETMNEELQKVESQNLVQSQKSFLEYFQSKILFISLYKKKKRQQIFYLYCT